MKAKLIKVYGKVENFEIYTVVIDFQERE